MNEVNTVWSKTTKYLVAIGLVILAIYILNLSREVIPLLVIAGLVAVITRPVITWLQQRTHLPHGGAVAVVYLAVLCLFPLALLLVIPPIASAVNYVLNLDYSAFLRNGLEWLRASLASIRSATIPIGPLDAYVDGIINEMLASLQITTASAPPATPSVSTVLQSLGAALTRTFSTVTGLVGALVSNIILLIFIFLASIYMNLSAHMYRESFLSAIPDAYQPEIAILLTRIGRMWSAFFRGQLTLMLIIGVISWLGLTMLGVPGALYLGIIAGLLELIPNLGPVIATIPAAIVALLQGSSQLPVSHLMMMLIVILFYILVQQLENNLIVPRVLGGAVNLPPLVVMTGVLVGATAYGILGALLATPVIATGREILIYIYGKMLGKDPFPQGQALLEPGPTAPSRMLDRLRGWVERLIPPHRPAPPAGDDPKGK